MTLPGFHTCVGCAGDGLDRSDDGWETGSPCELCGGAGQTPNQETIEVAAQSLFDLTKPMQPGSEVPPFGSFLTDNVYRHQAWAALLAYARHTQEQT